MTLVTRNVLFATYCLSVILVHLRALRSLVDLSRENETASHLIVVPFVTLVFIYQDRHAIFSSVRSAWRAGVGVICAGLGLVWAASWYQPSGGSDDSLTWAIGALVVLGIGGFLLFYGREAFRAALFPLLFLGLMIPIPSVLLDSAIAFLKTGSAETVAGLFSMSGTPYYREGFVFSLPTVVIEIADECSGIRSSIGLLLTSLMAGHMFLRTSWAKAVLVAAILPLAILKNGIRIVSLTLLSVHVDPGFLMGQLHHEGGIVFFLLALAILAPVLALLRSSEGRRKRTASVVTP